MQPSRKAWKKWQQTKVGEKRRVKHDSRAAEAMTKRYCAGGQEAESKIAPYSW